MNPKITVACLVISLLGYSSPVSAASIGRIVGGSQVDITDYPYQVGLLYSSSQVCGGSIIGEKWILTAASCTATRSVPLFSVRAGSTLRSDGGVVRAASNIYVHALYSSSTGEFDIGLISLESDLKYGAAINAVALPSPYRYVPEGVNGIITGWGSTAEDGEPSNRLVGVNVAVVENEVCQEIYGSIITRNMLCAGFVAGGRDSCQGDAGGPLVVNGYGQIGIVSWGRGCARPNSYGVYTRVTALRRWISSVSGI